MRNQIRPDVRQEESQKWRLGEDWDYISGSAGSKAGNAEHFPLAVLDGAHFVLSCSSQEQMRFSATVSKTSNQKYLWSGKRIGTCLYCVLPIHLVDSANIVKHALPTQTHACSIPFTIFFLVDLTSESSSLCGETKYTLKMISEHSQRTVFDALYWLKDKSLHFGHETWRLCNMEVDNIV